MRRHLSLLPLLLILGLPAAAQPDPAGEWTGQISIPGSPLGIEVLLERDGADWSGTIAIPLQNLRDFSLSGVEVDGRSVAFRMEGIPGTPSFDGTLAEDGSRIEGTFSQGGSSFPFFLDRADDARAATAERDAEALEGFAEAVRVAMDSLRVPGVAIAMVRGDEVIWMQGLGYADLEARRPVTPQTIFPIGSSTKAFTAASLAILVDDGLLDWETPVVEYLPAFRLDDPHASALMTPLDLLVHRSGLPRHDLMWYLSDLDGREIFSRLRHLEPTHGFRGAWQYQNLMYLAAGVLAEEVSGMEWEELVRQRLFRPLGMSTASLSIAEMRRRGGDLARGYTGGRKENTLMEYRELAHIAPAGSINASVEEMARWVSFNLGDGSMNGQQVLAETSLRYLHTPTTVVAGRTGMQESPMMLYSPGWFVEVYRGRRLVQHGGNIDGFSALVGFMPDEQTGIVILTNKNGTPITRPIMLAAFDRLLDVDGKDWLAEIAKTPPSATAEDEDAEVERVEGTSPSHALSAYAGRFHHPAYGQVVITEDAGSLRVKYNSIEAPLEHFHFDTFSMHVAAFDSDMRLTFHTGPRGDVERLELPLEPMGRAILFERAADEALLEPDYLARFAGVYRGSGLTFTVTHAGGSRLMLTVAGQGTWRLIPSRENNFSVEGMDGFSVRFEQEDGEVTRLIGIQPFGTFTARRES